MSKVICEREDLVNIADAVRTQTGNSEEMTLGEIATGISGISGGGSTGKALITSVPSADSGTSFRYIDESGNLVTVSCNSFLELEIPAPSIVISGYDDSTITVEIRGHGYDGTGYYIDKGLTNGLTILNDAGLTANGSAAHARAILVSKDAKISFNYIASDSEPS